MAMAMVMAMAMAMAMAMILRVVAVLQRHYGDANAKLLNLYSALAHAKNCKSYHRHGLMQQWRKKQSSHRVSQTKSYSRNQIQDTDHKCTISYIPNMIATVIRSNDMLRSFTARHTQIGSALT
jgi:hypothetical protein